MRCSHVCHMGVGSGRRESAPASGGSASSHHRRAVAAGSGCVGVGGLQASKQKARTYALFLVTDGPIDQLREAATSSWTCPHHYPSHQTMAATCYLLELRDPNDPDLPPVPLLLFPKLENGYRKISRNLSWAPAATIMILL
jgi:hypothetical protein